MMGRFVSIEVDLLNSEAVTQAEIERVLAQWQAYLCWVASDVDLPRQKLIIDAIVLDWP